MLVKSMIPLFLFGVSMGEVILIFLIALMLFGSKKIPDLARSLGKGMNEFKKATDGIKREFQESTEEIREEIKGMGSEIHQNSNAIRGLADDFYKDDYNAESYSETVRELNKPVDETGALQPQQDTAVLGKEAGTVGEPV